MRPEVKNNKSDSMETALELTFVDMTAQKLGAEVRNKQDIKKK